MSTVDPISFWTPIVPGASLKQTTQAWVCSHADQLLSFGHHVYRLEANDTLRLEQAPRRSI